MTATSSDLLGIERSATLSDCGTFRFDLTRRWGSGPIVSWLMLNPSTADAEHDDPTLRRITDFAAHWGYHGVIVVNVFPFRASKPKALWQWLAKGSGDALADQQALATNLATIERVAKTAALRMVGFGADVAEHAPEALHNAVSGFGLAGAMCLGSSSSGWPLHPMARGKSRVPAYAKPAYWAWPFAPTD